MFIIKYKAGKEVKTYVANTNKVDEATSKLPFDCLAKNILQVKRVEQPKPQGRYASSNKLLGYGCKLK